MTPEERAELLSAVLVDELGVPDWQRENVQAWCLNAVNAAVLAERERIAPVFAALLECAERNDFGMDQQFGGAGPYQPDPAIIAARAELERIRKGPNAT